MTFTDAAIALLKRLEGCRLEAYRDGAGVWTIGFGHTGGDVLPGTIWTQQDADVALFDDVQRFIVGAKSLIHPPANCPLTDNQFSAVVIFAYNVGLHALDTSTALRRLNMGQYSFVPPALMLFNKIHLPSGEFVVSPGLVARRQAEIDLWNSKN